MDGVAKEKETRFNICVSCRFDYIAIYRIYFTNNNLPRYFLINIHKRETLLIPH